MDQSTHRFRPYVLKAGEGWAYLNRTARKHSTRWQQAWRGIEPQSS